MQSPCLEGHVKTIAIYQSLSNNALFEQKCLQNTKKLYKHAGKFYEQQQFKDIIETAIVSTPEGFTDNSPRSPITPKTVKKPSARKSLCLFTNIFDVKNKTAVRRVRDAKSKRKAINQELHHDN